MEMVADLKSLIPALGYSSATVVAHDWGSPIVWTFAKMNPDLVDKMVHKIVCSFSDASLGP